MKPLMLGGQAHPLSPPSLSTLITCARLGFSTVDEETTTAWTFAMVGLCWPDDDPQCPRRPDHPDLASYGQAVIDYLHTLAPEVTPLRLWMAANSVALEVIGLAGIVTGAPAEPEIRDVEDFSEAEGVGVPSASSSPSATEGTPGPGLI